MNARCVCLSICAMKNQALSLDMRRGPNSCICYTYNSCVGTVYVTYSPSTPPTPALTIYTVYTTYSYIYVLLQYHVFLQLRTPTDTYSYSTPTVYTYNSCVGTVYVTYSPSTPPPRATTPCLDNPQHTLNVLSLTHNTPSTPSTQNPQHPQHTCLDNFEPSCFFVI